MKENELEKLEMMSFEELVKWAQTADWEKVTPEEERVYMNKSENLAKGYFYDKDISQLEEFYRTYSGDGIAPWFDAWAQSLRDTFPISELYERIAAIENSMEVLLKQHEKEFANITVGQLNRLKRGI